ncbi:MAG: divergent polysaccharide deacetylase family protein [Alphaproteobacteria bacterium]|nr:MAG: divergent polysaccharide deacetylase family protein [Alphaproteobacteria bacterium]
MSLVPIDYFEELDHRFTPRRRAQNSWSRTSTAFAAVLLSIAALIFALLLGQSQLPEGSRVVLRLEPQPASPARATTEELDISEPTPVPTKKPQDIVIYAETQPADVETLVTQPVPAQHTQRQQQKKIALTTAPISAVAAQGSDGWLPIRAANGATPLKIYARPFDASDTRPRIYLVIGGLGFFEGATQEAINTLPDAVTLGFAPYGDNLQEAINKARKDGHEVVLEVPMEPFAMGGQEPGPHTLKVDPGTEQAIADLHWLMSRTTGYVGLVNYLGARFMSQPDSLTPVLEDAKARGLMVLDDGSSQRSQLPRLASEVGAPWALNQRTIDAEPSQAAIDENLVSLEALAKTTGGVVAMGYAYPLTLERVAAWSKTLEEKGIVLAPLSAHVLSPKEKRFND